MLSPTPVELLDGIDMMVSTPSTRRMAFAIFALVRNLPTPV